MYSVVLYIPDGMYQLALHHSLAGSTQIGVVTCGLSYDGSNLAVDQTTVESSWANDVMDQMNLSWFFTRAVWSVQEGAVRDNTFDTQGGNGAPCEPPQIAALCKKVTGQPGRKARGRMYLPGISEDGVEPIGTLTSGYRDGWQTVMNTWKTACAAAHFTPVIFHNVNALPADPEDEPTIVTAFVVDNVVATQRRRLR